MVSIDNPRVDNPCKSYMGFSKNTFWTGTMTLKWQQTSSCGPQQTLPRHPQKTLAPCRTANHAPPVQNFSPREIYASVTGFLLVAPRHWSSSTNCAIVFVMLPVYLYL